MKVKRNTGLFIGDADVIPAKGTIEITENGLHNVAPYEFANVDVETIAEPFYSESYTVDGGDLTGCEIELTKEVTANIPDVCGYDIRSEFKATKL